MEASKQIEFLATIRNRFSIVQTADLLQRSLAVEDLNFVLGGDNQWPQAAIDARKDRPRITINKLPKFIRQVTGDQRQNRPSIKVRPVDSMADPQIATILEGHTRNIEYNSNAAFAYDNAFKQAVAGGYPGFWRVNTEYAEDDTFDQDICIEPIHNQFTVYCDPESLPDVHQGKLKWAFVTETISEDEAKERKIKTSGEFAQGDGEFYEGWYMEGSVRIAEYWYKEPVTKTICQLETGEVVDYSRIKQFIRDDGQGGSILSTPDGQGAIRIIKQRKVETHKVMWALVSGNEVLDGPKDWAGKYIPIVPVFGDTWNIEGKTHYKSLIRDAKDPQRTYNYTISQNMEATALQPKVPFILTPKQIEGYKPLWDSANTVSRPYLPYNPDPQAPKPGREPGVQPNPAYVQMSMQATDDLKDTTGIYDASLGQRSNEQSGRAILARQREGDVGTFEFIDNLTRAIQFTGKILVDLIPRIYDTERTLRTLGQDGTPNQVPVNKTITDPATGQRVIINDLTVGKYDCFVSTGPSFTTQRMEAADVMQSILQAAPQTAPIVLPRWIKMLDWPESQEMSQEIQQMMQPQGPQTPPISASVAIDLSSLRPDIADALIGKIIESGQIKANFKEAPDKVGNISGTLGDNGSSEQGQQLTPNEMGM